ncbi:hypothetical protein M408DRAFT_332485 [Serendipita vermifera MAFF 305830]|uniref:Uncharacterized protein n=1 Tax=Serendipita vermifera MAFF 305830 TaxID=933852 RepID=A0A0C2W9V6_SERVB|nr:hypothetical protein M408DRAFT_332485 [Serendipita vermifera MAFF 305830]
MVCDNGTCNAPAGYITPTYSYEPPTGSTSSTPDTPYVAPTYGPGASRTITPTYSNPYGTSYTISIPSYTIPIYGGSSPTPSPTCSRGGGCGGGGGGGGGGGSNGAGSGTGGGGGTHQNIIIAACLGAFGAIMVGVAGWLWKKKRDAEKALVACKISPLPTVEEEKA